ncbi:MAG: SRPBCC family protein [Thermomicrobiales bacterium]
MATEWKSTVHIDAPAAEVYDFLADFSHIPEWDETVTKVEAVEEGEVDGTGAKWKTFERLGSLKSDRDRKPVFDLENNVGIAMREVRELVPGQRVAWHSYMMPRIGVTSDCRFELEGGPRGTEVTLFIQLNVLSMLDTMVKKVFRSLEDKQEGQWQRSLVAVKSHLEAPVGAAV